jgi:MFS transporter, FHS family, L-fucose permease
LTGQAGYIRSIIILAILFFIIGFISWSNAILIPYFKLAFQLSGFQSYLVAFAFYISYLIISYPSSLVLKSYGYKKSMAIGLWIMSAGAFVFIPAAWIRSYPVFLLGLFTLGTGLSILQTASNPFITILGPIESAAKRLAIMGICNKGAGILAPLLLAFIILRPEDIEAIEQSDLAIGQMNHTLRLSLLDKVLVPYLVIALGLIVLGILVYRSSLPEITPDQEENTSERSIWSFPALVLGAVAIFFHVGAQILSVDTIVNYAVDTGLSLNQAKLLPSYVLSFTILGYLIGILAIPSYLHQRTALRICVCLGILISILIVGLQGTWTWNGITMQISVWLMVVLGLANSLTWGGIWPLAIQGLGSLTKVGSSLMIMGLCGNAIMPLLYGSLADHWGPRQAYMILIFCYLYLFFYAFYFYRWLRWPWIKESK